MLIAVCGIACQPEAELKSGTTPAVTEPTGDWTVEAKANSPGAVEAPTETSPEPSSVTEPAAETKVPAGETHPVAEPVKSQVASGEAKAPAVAESSTTTPASEPAVVAGPAETAKEGVAVTVNGIDITESQIEERIKPQLEKMSAQLPPSFVEQYKKQIRKQALEGMVVEQLLDGKIKESNIVVTEQDVTGHLEKIAAQQNLSLDDIKALIEARGQSFDEVKQRIRKGMGYQKFMESQWAGQINVSEDDAKKYYSENTAQFETPEQVKASHILIQPNTSDPNIDPNDAKAKAKVKAQQLLEQVKNGADFATLARENSNCPSAAKGGDLGFFGKGQMVPDFEKAAFELKVGQVSDIVETQFGYHIIKVTDHKDAHIDEFEQVKDNIVNTLTQKKQNEFAMHYVDSLKAGANIVYSPAEEAITEKPDVNKPAPQVTAP